MRRRSLKRQAQDEADREPVEAFEREHATCWACGERRSDLLQVHHIGGRAHPLRNHPANLSRFCWECHRCLTEYRTALQPIVVSLAYKRLRDPEQYDRLQVLRIRGRGPRFVEEDEVLAAIDRIKNGDTLLCR